MKPVKQFFINLALLIGGSMLVYLLSISLFATIFNAIMGNPVSGAYATNVFMRVCLLCINGFAICIPHARDAEARRAFLDVLGADKYDRKADFKALAKTKSFRNECIIYTILYVVMFVISMSPKWVYIVGIFAFPFVNLWHHTAVHKQWASERLHLAPKNQGEDEDNE